MKTFSNLKAQIERVPAKVVGKLHMNISNAGSVRKQALHDTPPFLISSDFRVATKVIAKNDGVSIVSKVVLFSFVLIKSCLMWTTSYSCCWNMKEI